MISKKLLNYLEKNKIKYEPVVHKTVYAVYDLAQTTGLKLSEIAKTLVVKIDNNYCLTVLPGSRRLDLNKLKKATRAKKVEIPKEKVMEKVFKIKPGTITPFGSLYKTPVYFEKGLIGAKKIVVGGGSYTDSIKIKTADFLKLEKPIIGIFGRKK